MKRELNLQNDRFTLKERLRERLYICAGSALTPVNVLAQLAFDKLDLVRRRVAENPKTPLAILENLAFDADTDVLAWQLNADWTDTLDFSDFTGIPNNSGTGKTGDIAFTTVGHSSGDVYNIVIQVSKSYA